MSDLNSKEKNEKRFKIGEVTFLLFFTLVVNSVFVVSPSVNSLAPAPGTSDSDQDVTFFYFFLILSACRFLR